MDHTGLDLEKNIEAFDLCFLDLETTGLDVITGDSICEIGIIKVRERKIIDTFQSLVNPKQSVPTQAYLVHKISDADLKDAPFFENIADKLIAFVNDSVICAYNVEFDMGFLNFELNKMGYGPLEIPAIDCLAMARKTLKLSRYNLGSIAAFFNLQGTDSLHRALADAAITSQVFFKLRDILKERGLEQLKDYISLFSLKDKIFKARQDPKTALTEHAIANQQILKIRYFSHNISIVQEAIRPLCLSQENNNLFLVYEDSKNLNQRISFKHILDIETVD